MKAAVLVCDYAQVNGGKLYVVGAGINMVLVNEAEPPHMVALWAGVVVTVPWPAHNQAHRLAVRLEHEDGERVRVASTPAGVDVSDEDEGKLLATFNAGRGPMMQPGDESLLPLAVPLSVRLPRLGGYRLTVELDGSDAAVARFRVYHSSVRAAVQSG
jgi:hypothetical protein